MTGMVASVASTSQDNPVGACEFAGLMARLGGFEPQPQLAVAVSGGADSMALCLLCHRWTQARGGAVLAITVDHRLRPESGAEAAAVGAQLRARGIAHTILTWEGDKPASGIQEAARAARYRLLVEYAAKLGLLHVMLAHHRDDQAETLLLRLAHVSGADGLSCMAAIREMPEVRLLRPLLPLSKARLVTTAKAFGLNWHEDPSNTAVKFARGRLRGAGVALEREGLTAAGLAETAHRMGLVRAALDEATATLLGHCVALDAAGFAWLEPEPLRAAPEEVARRALARCLAVIGRAAPPPRRERLESLLDSLKNGLPKGRTLAGCQISFHRGRVLVVREAAAVAAPAELSPGQRLHWDQRFWVRSTFDGGSPITIGALGVLGRTGVRDPVFHARIRVVPGLARPVLPALWDAHGLLAVPSLGWSRSDRSLVAEILFAPVLPLAGPTFGVVQGNAGLI